MGENTRKIIQMKSLDTRIIELTEYKSFSLDKEEFSEEEGRTLWTKYQNQISVEEPGFKTEHKWIFTSQGWVGYIPLTEKFHFSLQPKVPLSNLFRMLEYAYNLNQFKILDGMMDADSLIEFYERLANILAKRVLERSRKGFYRSYLNKIERLSYIRGRLNLKKAIQKPWRTDLVCHYEEHTPDIEENHILAWTLFRIPQSGLCTERTLPSIRKAYRSLRGMVSLEPLMPKSCIGRIYNRLNKDYLPMHSLCRFFLEQTGPSHRVGNHKFLPFLVGMAKLYERFVAEWLDQNLPVEYALKIQESVKFGKEEEIEFDIDLVIYEKETDNPRFILDTKYKIPKKVDSSDLHQVIAYAESKRCKEAILIYPSSLENSIDEIIGDIRVRSLTFSLDDNLDDAGNIFIKELLE